MTTSTETYQKHIQPDIGYLPDPEKYALRTQHRVKNEKLHLTGLPVGFPQRLVSTFAWEGKDLAKGYDSVYALSEQEAAEVERALAHFKCTIPSFISFQQHFELTTSFTALKKPLGYISQETFPLPTLHPILRSISRELHFGHGFKVLRGLPVWRHEREDSIIMYAGVSSHVAPIRGRQDKKFEGKPADVVLSHIKDLSATADKGRIGAPAYTAEKQVFHTDIGDIVSLLALSVAAEGGQSKLSSSWRVYNELAETRPDLIATLAEDWVAEKSVLTSLAVNPGPLKAVLTLRTVSATRSTPITNVLYSIICLRPTRMKRESSFSTLGEPSQGTKPSLDHLKSRPSPKPRPKPSTLFISLQIDSM